MMTNGKIAAALVGGYLLGRTRKGKLAIGLGMLLAGRKLRLDPRELGRLVAESPLLSGLNSQVRKELVDATKSAAGKALTSRVNGLADSLHDRTEGLRGTDEEPDEKEPDEEPQAEEEPEEEAEPEEESEPEPEEATGEDEEPEEPPRARKSPRTASRSASDTKREGAASRTRKSPGSGTRKAAAGTRKAASGTRSKAGSAPRGGGRGREGDRDG